MSDIIANEEFVACFGIACFTLFMLVVLCLNRKSGKPESYQIPTSSNIWHTETCYAPGFIILHRCDNNHELAIRSDKICGFFEDDSKHTVVQYGESKQVLVMESFDEVRAIFGPLASCKKEETD